MDHRPLSTPSLTRVNESALPWARKALLLALLLLTAACQEPDQLDAIRETGTLRVVTRNGPTTYYQDRSGPTGFEHELARRLAPELGGAAESRSGDRLAAVVTAGGA